MRVFVIALAVFSVAAALCEMIGAMNEQARVVTPFARMCNAVCNAAVAAWGFYVL